MGLRFAIAFCISVAISVPGHAQQAPQTLSPVVQVAVNYGPGRSSMISGFITGDGHFVVTQADILDHAVEIAVALSNMDVLDPVIEHVDERFNIALLRLPAPVPASLIPAGDFSARTAAVMGSPEAFLIGKSVVRLTPVEGKQQWRMEPSIPSAFRGGAILNDAGELLGIAVQPAKGQAVIGVPVSEFMLPGARSAIATKLAPARARPAKKETAAEAVPPPASVVLAPASPPVVAAPPPPEIAIVPPASRPEPPPGSAGVPPASRPEVSPSVSTAAAAPTASQPRNTPSPAPPATPPPAISPASGQSNLAAWQDRVQQEPHNLDLQLRFTEVLLSAGMYDRAVAAAEAAQARFPDEGRLYWHLAMAYLQKASHKDDGSRRRTLEKRNYLKSRRAFEIFLERAPGDPHAAEASVILKRLKEADFGRY